MLRPTQIAIPTLVRVKDGALDRLGIYLARGGHRRVAVLVSKGLAPPHGPYRKHRARRGSRVRISSTSGSTSRPDSTV